MHMLDRNIHDALIGALLLIIFLTLPVDYIDGREVSAVLSDENSWEAVYVGNAGFMFSIGDKKILIDAVFRNHADWCHSPTEEMQQQMEQGLPPFDHIDLILATHAHGDHFHPQAVKSCLESNPGAVFVSTPEAVKQVRELCRDSSEIPARIKTYQIENGRSIEDISGGIRIRIMSLPHSGEFKAVQNFMFLITVDEQTVFHEGDASASAEAFAPFNLAEESIDAAVLHVWYVMHPDGNRLIREFLRPKYILAAHIQNRLREDAVEKVRLLQRNFPNLVYLKEHLDKKILR